MKHLKTINELHSDTYKSAFEKTGNPKFLEQEFGQIPYTFDQVFGIVTDCDISKCYDYINNNKLVDIGLVNADPGTIEEALEYEKIADRFDIETSIDEVEHDNIIFNISGYPDGVDVVEDGHFNNIVYSGPMRNYPSYYSLIAYLLGYNKVFIFMVEWHNDVCIAVLIK